MNTPPPLSKPPQAKFSWKHYVGMILVCWLVSFFVTNFFRRVLGDRNEEAEAISLNEETEATFSALQEAIQDIQQEINEQYERIDTLWEKIEEIENR